MKRAKDLRGRRYGRLTVVEFAGADRHRRATWLCRCECGRYTTVASPNLKKGYTKSCGCLHKELNRGVTQEGGKRKALYGVWASMKDRCLNPKNKSYPYYGGCGVSVCEEWLNFEPFLIWAKQSGYVPGLTLDRIDPNGDYCPQNCRWVSRQVQSINQKNMQLKHRGVCWHKASGKWAARVFCMGEEVWNDLFQNYEEACRQAEQTREKYHQKIIEEAVANE